MNEVRYELKKGWSGGNPDKAPEYMEELNRLLALNEGVPLKPEQVVESAQDTSSVLHGVFEWEDTVAAANWRRHQARNLMNHLEVVIVNEEERHIRAFFHVVTDKGHKGYVSYKDVAEVPDYHQQVLREAVRQIKHWNRRYKDYKELRHINDAIEETLAELKMAA